MIKPRVLVGPLEMSLSSQGSIVEILSNTMLRLGRFVYESPSHNALFGKMKI